MRQPDFFVVGAAKSGTTALWHYFKKHPEIYVTEDISIKELGYYSNQYGISNKTRYLKYFEKAEQSQLIGEVCTVYLTSSESAEWIKKEVPQAKIIITLRNPVNRAFSLYNWMVMEGYERISSFEKAIKIEDKRLKNRDDFLHKFDQNYLYFETGLYFKQVKRYFEIFGEENVLVIAHENLKKNQLNILNKVYIFLGVDPLNEIKIESINKSKKILFVKLQFMCRKYLLKRKRSKKIKFFVLRIMELNKINKKPSKINFVLRNNLKYRYLEDVKELSKLCNYDFYNLWFKYQKKTLFVAFKK